MTKYLRRVCRQSYPCYKQGNWCIVNSERQTLGLMVGGSIPLRPTKRLEVGIQLTLIGLSRLCYGIAN